MEANNPHTFGWPQSAQAWIDFVDRGDNSRTELLDGAMLDFVDDPSGLLACDVGCGEGRFCRMLSDRGATTVGLDPTPAFLAQARARHPGGRYVKASAEALPFANGAFDLVVAYLTLIDIPDFRKAIAEMARVARHGGLIAIANLCPHATAAGGGWLRDDEGKKTVFPIDHYFDERADNVEWADIHVVNFHRPLRAYMQAFLSSGLVLDRFDEPEYAQELIDSDERFAGANRVPYFHTMLWHKA